MEGCICLWVHPFSYLSFSAKKEQLMIKLLLYPLSLLYGVVVYFRNKIYDLGIKKSKKFDLPIISVGNITVGGTGKTPHVEYLVNLLKDEFEVATLSRGYKRKTKGFFYVDTNSTIQEVGDEPLQIKMKFTDITVSVCENRVVGVENLLKHGGRKVPEVVLLDDAFQHRRITPGMNILLIDYNRPIHKDTFLPTGRLRESISQTKRANVMIFTKCPDILNLHQQKNLQDKVGLKPGQEIFFTSLGYEKLKPVFSANYIDNDFYEKPIYSALIVTGIASPKLMHKYLNKILKDFETITFPDHYNFTEGDIITIQKKFNGLNSEKKIIITTEKDAVRLKDREDLPNEIINSLYYLPIKVKFLANGEKTFNKKILDYVGSN